MGSWRTVNITGTMTAFHAERLWFLLARQHDSWGCWDKPYACLSFSAQRPSLCGLNNWAAEVVNASGNLAERDYSVEDVAGALRVLAHIAPSMLLKVHCGGEYESDECVATVSVGEGLVVVGKPEVEKVSGPSVEQMQGNLLRNLLR